MGTNFARNIQALRNSKGWTQKQLSEKLGVTQGTISQWEKLGHNPRSPEVTQALLDLFGVDETLLFGFSDGFYAKQYGLSEQPDGALAPTEPRKAYAPVLATVHAGTEDLSAHIEERVPIPYEVWANHKTGFFLEVIGDCMDLVYPERCLVYIDPDREPVNGSIAVVEIDGQFIMRRWYKGKNSLLLASESTNPQWDDIIITENLDTIRSHGVVVWFQAREELE